VQPWLLQFLQTLPDVEIRPSRFGGSAVLAGFVGKREFVHPHGADAVDIRLSPARQRSLAGDSRAVFRKARSPWMELRIPDVASQQVATMVLQMAYEQAKGP
jgi:Luciferase